MRVRVLCGKEGGVGIHRNRDRVVQKSLNRRSMIIIVNHAGKLTKKIHIVEKRKNVNGKE